MIPELDGLELGRRDSHRPVEAGMDGTVPSPDTESDGARERVEQDVLNTISDPIIAGYVADCISARMASGSATSATSPETPSSPDETSE